MNYTHQPATPVGSMTIRAVSAVLERPEQASEMRRKMAAAVTHGFMNALMPRVRVLCGMEEV